MPTENPKISAYVPQVVYDRFKQFQEERGLSMSQAAIELLAEYFDINLAENSNKEFTGGLPNRISQLEQLVADLKQSYVYLSEKVDYIQSTSELQTNDLPISSSNGRLPSELPDDTESKLFCEPDSELPITKFLIEQESKLLDDGEPPNNDKSEPLNLSPHQTEIVDSQKLQFELVGEPLKVDIAELKPLNSTELSKRFNKPDGFVKSKKFSYKDRIEDFLNLLKESDPQNIGWWYSQVDKKYHPILESQDLRTGSD